MQIPFPVSGTLGQALLEELDNLSLNDADWRNGRTFSLVFYPGPEVEELIKKAYTRFFFENGLSPASFRSLGRMEAEVVSMTASLLQAPEDAVGNMTSGGTESILCAVRAAMAYASARGTSNSQGNLVMPETAHPAFNKAADYLGLELRIARCHGEELLPSVSEMSALVNADTVMIVGSAPAYPHGAIDPIEELSELAVEKNVWLHVDACVGGYIIPFIEFLGEPIRAFDFRFPGVHSVSLDLHKYGYGAKGSSVILYRNAKLRQGQYFVFSNWPGGLYASPSVSGTRPGGAVAAAWTVMRHMGREGYVEYARMTLQAARRIQSAVNGIAGLSVVGRPQLPVFSIRSTGAINIYHLGDALSAMGWHLDRQLQPPSLHLTVSYGNVAHVDDFIRDLREAVAKVQDNSFESMGDRTIQRLTYFAARFLPESWVRKVTSKNIAAIPERKEGTGKTAPLYGLVGELSGKGTIDDMLKELLNVMNKPII